MIEMIMNAWTAQAITATVDLGIADALADGPLRVEELASRVNADPDALRRLLRALIGRGVFRQRRDGRYELNPLADTLRSSAPLSAAGLATMVGSRQHREHWSYLADAIRTGGAVIPAVNGTDAFDYLSREPELAEAFNRAMAETTEMTVASLMAAYSFDPYPTVVDVGGGVKVVLATILAATPRAGGSRPAPCRHRGSTAVAPAWNRGSCQGGGGIILRQRARRRRHLRSEERDS
jgi:hypothetical protein